jgi:NTE family protein
MLIVSDGGGPFGFSPAPGPRHQIKNLTRLNDIADTQARRLRRRILNERHAQHGNPSLIWAIDHPVTPEPRKASEGYTVRLVEAYIARMRTDLDAFSADEQSILENHGYSLAQDQLKRLTSREEWAIRAAAAVLPGGSADADFSWPGPHADYDESRAEELLRMMKSDERRSVWKAAGHAIGGFIKTALGRR